MNKDIRNAIENILSREIPADFSQHRNKPITDSPHIDISTTDTEYSKQESISVVCMNVEQDVEITVITETADENEPLVAQVISLIPNQLIDGVRIYLDRSTIENDGEGEKPFFARTINFVAEYRL